MRFFLKCTLYITVLIFTIVLLPREYVNSLTTNPVMVKDIYTGGFDSSYDETAYVAFNNQLFFTAYHPATGAELWKSDGTDAGTMLVKDIVSGSGSSGPLDFYGEATDLYFQAYTAATGTELWKSDGTEAGTVMVKDINSGTNSSSPESFVSYNNLVYFRASNGVNGSELWKTDGTEAGTVMVKDIATGAGNSYPDKLAVMGNTIYFEAVDGVNGFELWKSDGTDAGTIIVKDINVGAGSSYADFLVVVNNLLFFAADNGTSGKELWKSDGTEAGTVLVKDINSGGASSNPNGYPKSFTVLNNNLYFNASVGINGFELWKSDGTEAGTVMVKDIIAGASSSSPSYLAAFDNAIYFQAYDPVIDEELWKSDGTEAGTVLVEDLEPDWGSEPSYLTVAGDTLFFYVDVGIYGNELWKMDRIIPSPTPTNTPTPTLTLTPTSTLNLQLTNINGITITPGVDKYYHHSNSNILFKGITYPLANVKITINSEPKICETTADSEGYFECNFPYIENGLHTVTIVATSTGGQVYTYPQFTLGINVSLVPTGKESVVPMIIGSVLFIFGILIISIKTNQSVK